MDEFLKKLRAPTMTVHDLPSGGDRQLEHAATELDTETGDAPYTPPLPVPIGRPQELAEGMRGLASEVWIVSPPATLPGLGTLATGEASEKGSQFAINSIRVDNFSGQWVYFPEVGAWVPPTWYGRVFRSDGGRVQRVKFETPPGITPETVETTDVVRVVFSNEYWGEVDGENIAGIAPAIPSNVVLVGSDTGAAQTQAYSADAASNSLLGLVVNARQFAETGASAQRVRVPNVFKTFGPLAVGASSTATVWTPAAGLRPRLLGFLVNQTSISAADGMVTFFDNTTTGAIMGGSGWLNDPVLNTASNPAIVSYGGFGPIVATSSNLIVAWSSNAVNIAGMVYGTEE